MSAPTLVFFDMETGGLKDDHPDIQVAMVAVRGGKELEEREWKIRFDPAGADPEALKMNSYDPEKWKAEELEERMVVEGIRLFLSRHASLTKHGKHPPHRAYRVARLAGHNARTFDGPRLRRMFRRHDVFLPADSGRELDTVQLALWALLGAPKEPKSYRLGDLCESLSIQSRGAHDALADVHMTVELARVLASGSWRQKEQPCSDSSG